MTYVKHAYDIVLESEYKLGVNLDHETEAYVVQLVARYIDRPNINKDPIATKMLSGMQMPKEQKKSVLKEVADECLLIDGLSLGKNRWPSVRYYQDIGKIAYSNVAYITNPPETFFEELASNFSLISTVIGKIKI